MKREELAEHYAQVNFVAQDAVRWLAPSELRTYGYSLLSEIFGNYADKRELQKVFDGNLLDLSDGPGPGEDFWFDYTADIGDGFDATYTVAALMAQDSLLVDGAAKPLPRGRMLVLGGDEVYPTASSKAYDDRMVGPYRAALPAADPQPLLLALPGNHDWYDGLTAFLRLFTQGRSIGGWRTEQRRSYFTVKLPHGWWLVGLDSQLDSYFDDPQLTYFEETLTANLAEGDSVIVCAATPAWLKASSGQPDAFNGLDWFERTFVTTRRVPGTNEREPTGATARLWLSGDKHHYLRYAEDLEDPMAPKGAERQMVTCGIGGAYLDVTHGLATELRLLPEESRSWRDGDGETTFTRQPTTFPSEADSRARVARLGLPWRKEWILRRNPGVFSFFAFAHVVIFVTLLVAFWQGVSANDNGRIVDAYLSAGSSALLTFAGGLLGVLAVLFVIALIPRLRGRPPLISVAMMVLALAQLLVACACFVGLALLPVGTLGPLAPWPKFFAVLIGVALIGGLLGATALGLWIVAFKSEGMDSWAMMGQAVEEGKGFLRIRLRPGGVLTVYPIVTEELVRDYDISPEMVTTSAGRSTRIPVPQDPLPTPRLIEEPFTVRPTET
ncbi:MAG: hypothetical protein WBL35_17135 [Ornithinibacter sp.]